MGCIQWPQIPLSDHFYPQFLDRSSQWEIVFGFIFNLHTIIDIQVGPRRTKKILYSRILCPKVILESGSGLVGEKLPQLYKLSVEIGGKQNLS